MVASVILHHAAGAPGRFGPVATDSVPLSPSRPMPTTIQQGYQPGCIGRIVHMHAEYYAAASGFGSAFEAKVARELAEFCQTFQPGRDVSGSVPTTSASSSTV